MTPLNDLGFVFAASLRISLSEFSIFEEGIVWAKASINAVALKENQKLATECSNLLATCNKWKRECSLYDHDREALMDFANEADERAKEAEVRNRDLAEEKKIFKITNALLNEEYLLISRPFFHMFIRLRR